MNQVLKDLPNERFYLLFIGLLQQDADAQGYQGLPYLVMYDRLLLNTDKIEELTEGLFQKHQVELEAQEKLRAAITWRKKQLRARAAIFGNQN